MIKHLAATLAVATLLISAGDAAAQTFDFTGHFTAGSGTVTGQVVYDPGTSQITSATITTSAGMDQNAAPYAGETYTVINDSSAGHLFISNGPQIAGARQLNIGFNPSLPSAGAVVSMSEVLCTSANCNSATFYRQTYAQDTFSAPAVAAVPTLSEWAMILFTLTLAGGAAMIVQRRRMTL